MGRRQPSGQFTSAAGKLNQGLPGTNSTSRHNERVLNPGTPDLKAKKKKKKKREKTIDDKQRISLIL